MSHSPSPSDPASPPRTPLLHWTPTTSTWAPAPPCPLPPPTTPRTPLRILTWNLDFAAPHAAARATRLAAHIGTLSPLPEILLLQEVSPSALAALLALPFMRTYYASTTLHIPGGTYGTVTFVWTVLSSRCRAESWRVPYARTTMGRDCLFVDLGAGGPWRLRIANTHLESLDGVSEGIRGEQLRAVMAWLREEGVAAAVLGGDFNPVGKGDRDLVERLGGVDLWYCRAACGRRPGEGRHGETWGFQPPSRWPVRRMDKVVGVGAVRLCEEVEGRGIEVVGRGVKTRGFLGYGGVWVSDHFGVVADVAFEVESEEWKKAAEKWRIVEKDEKRAD